MGLEKTMLETGRGQEVTAKYTLREILKARYEASALLMKLSVDVSPHSWDDFLAKLEGCLGEHKSLLEMKILNSIHSLDRIINYFDAMVLLQNKVGAPDVSSTYVLLELNVLAQIDANPQTEDIRNVRLFNM